MEAYRIDTVGDLAIVLQEIEQVAKPKKSPLIAFCGQDEKHLVALALEAYAERYVEHNGYIAQGFAELARVERTEH